MNPKTFFAEPEAAALVNGSTSMRTATSSKAPDLTATQEPAALRESVEAPYKPYGKPKPAEFGGQRP